MGDIDHPASAAPDSRSAMDAGSASGMGARSGSGMSAGSGISASSRSGSGGGSGRGPTAGWARPLGIATIAVVVAVSFGQHPAPALHGSGLAVTIALIVLVASIAAILRNPRGRRTTIVAPVAMIAASAVLIWTQDGSPAIAGLFIVVSYAAMRLPLQRSLAMLALAMAALAVAAVHRGRSPGLIVSAELGLIAFYVIASFLRSAQEAHERTTALLAEVEASRSAREEAAALRERSRIAREIHDVLAHSLSGLMLQLEGARMLSREPTANGQLPAALDRAHRLARDGLEEARRAIGALRDEDLPGPDRLAQLAADFARDSQIEVTLDTSGSPHPLSSQASLTLFRVAQEALTNTRKHAYAGRVELHLAYESTGTRLVVEDHRSPVATPTVAPAEESSAGGSPRQEYGLTGMRERAELLGGHLDARSTADGFRVELWIPE
jgi:signal transduction histidine kinase